MRYDQWREDMHDGVDAVHKNLWAQRPLTITEATRLHESINAIADPDRLKDDTIFRTGGVIGRNNAERINGIAKSFHRLNRGRDGG